MPTYDYECKKCGKFELFQQITAEALDKCPTCNGKVKRLISSGAGLIFKGSGFYATDYRKPEKKKKDAPEGKCPQADKCPKSCPAKDE